MFLIIGKSALKHHNFCNPSIDLSAPQCHGRDLVPIDHTLGRTPDWRWKVAIPCKTGNHVPVQVRHPIAQRRQVHFDGLQVLAQSLLELLNYIHAMRAVGSGQVSKIPPRGRSTQRGEGRETRLVGANHAQLVVAPDECVAVLRAQLANRAKRGSHVELRGGHNYTSTRSMPP